MYLPDTARPRAKGYSEAGSSITRRALKSFRADSGSPNEDINYNNATLRQRARMLYLAAPVAASAINTNRTKVVGVGLTLKSAVGPGCAEPLLRGRQGMAAAHRSRVSALVQPPEL